MLFLIATNITIYKELKMSIADKTKGALNAGQKLLSQNALTKYSILPGAAGVAGGLGYGAYDKVTNPYAFESMGDYAMKGGLIGVGIGGVAASSGRVLRDYRIFKQSKYTNSASAAANSSSSRGVYGLSSFGEALARS